MDALGTHEVTQLLQQTSALINEAYLRLINWKDVRWKNRPTSSASPRR